MIKTSRQPWAGLDAMNTLKYDSEKPSRAVYHSLIETAFADSKVLAAGIVATLGAMLLTAFTTGAAVMWALSFVFACVGLVRLYFVKAFNYKREFEQLSKDDYPSWENRFTVFAVLHCFTFGLWCFAAAYIDDPFARQVSITVTFANLIGICGRSYPLSRLVNMQLIATTIPIVAGLFYSAGYYTVLALFIVPYMFGIQSIASYQRRVLFENIFQRQKAQLLASQFHSALNNVPQGICMFDAFDRLEVANEHVVRFAGRSQRALRGMSISQLIELMCTQLQLSEDEADKLTAWNAGKQTKSPERLDLTLKLHTTEVRHVRFRATEMSDGGVICTFDDITAEVEAADKIEHMEQYDRLTSLMRRIVLPGYIESVWNNRNPEDNIALLLLNIDGFKQINDDHGHHFGDGLLQHFSKRLTKTVGSLGTCARYGGDEFAVVVHGADCVDVTTILADSLTDAMAEPFSFDGRNLKINTSVGIAFANDDGCNSTDDLTKNADMARLSAKRDGHDTWRVFDVSMVRELQERKKLETDLSQALEKNQLEVVFQPLVSVKSGTVVSFEALMRWYHPEHGYVPPFRFIPIAEQLGLVVEMGAWILEESCKQCATWPNDTCVAVNLSSIQFTQGDIVESVQRALKISGLAPERLELEITESLMLDDMSGTIEKLNKFKDLGIRISLDDFGTGYSSLSYMSKLPLDKVKIDRSFVVGMHQDSKSLTLIQAIVALGHQLGLKVVIEGVETSEELTTLLKKSEPDEIQGYLFSRPVSASLAQNLLSLQSQENKSMLATMKSCFQKAA